MAVSDEAGDIKEFNHYDPWGKVTSTRVDPQPPSADVLANSIPRGFTDHEMLLDLGLVHMNGRVYDPVLGRFLSADPFIGDAGDAQDYNRYSYLGNNPLGGTDPSGYFKLSLKDIGKIVAVVVISVVTYGAASAAVAGWMAGSVASGTICASTAGVIAAAAGGAAAGFASGFAGSLLNGGSIGDAFRTGAVGSVIGGISAGAGAYAIRNLPTSLQWLDDHSVTEAATEGFLAGATEGALSTVAYGGNLGQNMMRYAFQDAAASGAGAAGKELWLNYRMPGIVEKGANLDALAKSDPETAATYRKMLIKAAKADSIAPAAALVGGLVGAGIGYALGGDQTSAMAGALIGGGIGFSISGIELRGKLSQLSMPSGGGIDAKLSGAPVVFGMPIKSQAFQVDLQAFSSGWKFGGSFSSSGVYDTSLPYLGIWHGFGGPRKTGPNYALPSGR